MDEFDNFFISSENTEKIKNVFNDLISRILNFKNRDKVITYYESDYFINKYIEPIPSEPNNIDNLNSIIEGLLDESTNFCSKMFMGFPDCSNSISGLMGGIIETTCQQNLLNSDFCARAATFIEICTVLWLRELIGYPIPQSLGSIRDIGGVATTGGTCSNMYGLLMARKQAYPDTFSRGLPKNAKPKILIPADITHYSIEGAVGLLGLGTENIVKVPTKNFAMHLHSLTRILLQLKENGDDIICVVLNAGDSRTLTIDPIQEAIEIIRSIAPRCWIHIDACHGGQLLFSENYRQRIKAIELSDSISLDPHKVFNLPYTLSYFIFKEPKQIEGFWTSSSLIMRDPWSLGQLTPNIGSKTWASLKFYLLVKHLGKKNLSRLIDKRIEMAIKFRNLIESTKKFKLVTDRTDINSVPFIYTGENPLITESPEAIYAINERIYKHLLKTGRYYIHGFPIKNDTKIEGLDQNKPLFALRYMSGNPRVDEQNIKELVSTLLSDAARIESNFYASQYKHE